MNKRLVIALVAGGGMLAVLGAPRAAHASHDDVLVAFVAGVAVGYVLHDGHRVRHVAPVTYVHHHHGVRHRHVPRGHYVAPRTVIHHHHHYHTGTPAHRRHHAPVPRHARYRY
jgi:hypothetical protein